MILDTDLLVNHENLRQKIISNILANNFVVKNMDDQITKLRSQFA